MNNRDEINRTKELARAYVPFQIMNQVYSQQEALRKGTLFPELYRPYTRENNARDGGRRYYE